MHVRKIEIKKSEVKIEKLEVEIANLEQKIGDAEGKKKLSLGIIVIIGKY